MSVELWLLRSAEDLPRHVHALSLLRSQHAGILFFFFNLNLFVKGSPGGQSCTFGKGLHVHRAEECGKYLGRVAARAGEPLHRAHSPSLAPCSTVAAAVDRGAGESWDGGCTWPHGVEAREVSCEYQASARGGEHQGTRAIGWALGDGATEPQFLLPAKPLS